MRERDNATNHLVGLAGIHAQTNVDIERCVELGVVGFFYFLCGLGERVGFPGFNLL